MGGAGRWSGMHRSVLLLLLLPLAACSDDEVPENGAAVPPISVTSETPGDWSALSELVGRTPADGALIDNSPISVDLNATLGPDAQRFRSAMMRAGPLTREGPLLIARAPDAWLVLQPGDHAFRAALRTAQGWREWQTHAAEVPRPAGV